MTSATAQPERLAARVRLSSAASWHNFFYGALEPSGQLSIDKAPVDLSQQVASTKLWWAFALTAVLLVPLVGRLSGAIDDADPTLLGLATTVRALAALVQFLGLIRWPFSSPTSPVSRPKPTRPRGDARWKLAERLTPIRLRRLVALAGRHRRRASRLVMCARIRGGHRFAWRLAGWRGRPSSGIGSHGAA